MLRRSDKKSLKINASCFSKTGIDLAIRKAGQTGPKKQGDDSVQLIPLSFT
jgi:hypothetical protein